VTPVLDPATGAPLRGVVGIRAGYGHTCARLADLRVLCWGLNVSGQVGDGTTTTTRPWPTVVVDGAGQPLRDVTSIAGSWYHTCAVSADLRAMCWGADVNAQLGTGGADATRAQLVLEQDEPMAGVTAIVTGRTHTCARRNGGTVTCWGYRGGGSAGAEPALVFDSAGQPLHDVRRLAAGEGFSCALLQDRTMTCWGDNQLGQLGTRDGAPSLVAMPVLDEPGTGLIRDAFEITAGGAHACAVLEFGDVRCWGDNARGQRT
jgi:alpha-tubulin suppressor-like RCC1 family protein